MPCYQHQPSLLPKIPSSSRLHADSSRSTLSSEDSLADISEDDEDLDERFERHDNRLFHRGRRRMSKVLTMNNPFCPDTLSVILTADRRRWTHTFPHGMTWFSAFQCAIHQCCVTRVGTRTRVLFTRTRTRVQFFSLWLGLRNRDSWLWPESRSSPSSSGRAVLRCLLWHSVHFVVCFHVLEDKQMLNMWTTRFVTRTQKMFWLGLWGDDSHSDSDFQVMTRTRTQRWWLGLGLGLRGDDSDSDFEVMTRTRTQRWWLGLGLGFDNLDSDTALPFIKFLVLLFACF